MDRPVFLRARRTSRNEPAEHVQVTREAILDAIRHYDSEFPANDYRDEGRPPWLEDDIDRIGAHEWALWFEGRCYPAKHILRLATGFRYFKGGWGTGNANEVLAAVGFAITPRPHLHRDWSTYQRPARYL
jgi:hypothetical protein